MFPGQPSHRISIHAPREGGDVKMPTIPKGILRFQSTPPARGATNHIDQGACASQNFNPRPPRGGRRNLPGLMATCICISIHAPREGGDHICKVANNLIKIFQSTPPARGATFLICLSMPFSFISIHAPREGGDHMILVLSIQFLQISIHAPREGGD